MGCGNPEGISCPGLYCCFPAAPATATKGNYRGRMVCEKCEFRGPFCGRRKVGEPNWSSPGTLPLFFGFGHRSLVLVSVFRPTLPFDYSCPTPTIILSYMFCIPDGPSFCTSLFALLPLNPEYPIQVLDWFPHPTDPQG